jgi:hypothetical protein
MKSTRYVLNLSPEVLIAIGSVSAQFATLEFYMARTTVGFIERFNNRQSKQFSSISFVGRRNAFSESAEYPNVPVGLREAVVKLVARIMAVENKRHTIIHGMANESSTPDGPLPADADKILISRDHPKHYFADRFSVAQITAIADEIADINGDLLQMYFSIYGASAYS